MKLSKAQTEDGLVHVVEHLIAELRILACQEGQQTETGWLIPAVPASALFVGDKAPLSCLRCLVTLP